jgi:L-threonylcarbamoyladenylate synthase
MKIIKFDKENLTEIAQSIALGQVCVLPTDTLYGLSCSTKFPQAVEKMYQLKERENNKPFIILISALQDLEKFEVNLSDDQRALLKKNWPNPLSVVLDCPSTELEYLHRGTYSLAFRMPNYPSLIELLKLTGPLTTTTVNRTNQSHVTNFEQALDLFGDKVDLYLKSDLTLNAPPSTVIRLTQGGYETLRQGDYHVLD